MCAIRTVRFLSEKESLANDYENSLLVKALNETETKDTKANYWLMCVELNNKERDFLKSTNLAGLMTRPIWQLMYRLPMYKDY